VSIIDGLNVNGNFNGLPYRGKNIFLKEDDPAEKKPQLLSNTRIRVFNLSSDDERKDLEKILTNIHNLQIHQQALISKLEYQYEEKIQCWMALLVWVEYYLTSPEDLANVISKARCE